LSHLFHAAAVGFFWTLSIVFAVGLIGCVLVVILTTIDDVKELVEQKQELRSVSSVLSSVPHAAEPLGRFE
jgi:hypothetical protein